MYLLTLVLSQYTITQEVIRVSYCDGIKVYHTINI